MAPPAPLRYGRGTLPVTARRRQQAQRWGHRSAPTGLAAQPGDGEVTLSWSDARNATITRYEVSSNGGATFSTISGSGAATTTHTATGVTNGTVYTLAVRAVNDFGNGAASSITATPNPIPAAPVGLSATPGDRQVALCWTGPNIGGVTGYRYRLSTDGDTTFTAHNISGSGASTNSYTVTGLTELDHLHVRGPGVVLMGSNSWCNRVSGVAAHPDADAIAGRQLDQRERRRGHGDCGP